MDRRLQARIDSDPVLLAATEWFVELNSDTVSGERVAEWQDWMSNQNHQRAFESVEHFWSFDIRTGAVHWPTDARVATDRYSGDETVSAWRTQQTSAVRPGLPRIRRILPWALAASVCAAVALFWMTDRGLAVQTVVGETRTLTLSDGSRITAGASTDLTTNFDAHTREITLKQGEAFFEVATDRQRPFTVHTGTASVTAIGTAFNIRRNGSHIVIAVAEGAVRVAGPAVARLQAGEQLTLNAAVSQTRTRVDADAVGNWRAGELRYINEPLSIVVADLVRYSGTAIRIDDAEIGNLQVTGILREKSIDGWLSSLEGTLGIRVIRHPDGSVQLKAK